MGRKYNTPYKRGRYHYSKKALKADVSKTAKNTLKDTPANRRKWARDPRKYDIWGIDTRPKDEFLYTYFKYRRRSKKILGKKKGRENKHYRRYWKK